MSDEGSKSYVVLCPFRVGVEAYRAQLAVLVVEDFGLLHYGSEDNVFRESVCLSCTEHACCNDPEILVVVTVILDLDHLCFRRERKSFVLGNDEDSSLDLKSAVKVISDDRAVL